MNVRAEKVLTLSTFCILVSNNSLLCSVYKAHKLHSVNARERQVVSKLKILILFRYISFITVSNAYLSYQHIINNQFKFTIYVY